MSDYMFMLESHLSPEQNQVVGWVEEAAAGVGINAFLAGGAMRDTLGGFPIRDLDFIVEGNPAKVVKWLEQKRGAHVVEGSESHRGGTELEFANGVHAQIAQAVQMSYGKPGSKPQAKPADIRDYLRGRDFTINSIAISLSKGSRGLLLDPTNGLSDLERREIRANSNYTLYDDPSRILRMFRLRARLGFELDPRTQQQYENVREAGLEAKIAIRDLADELRQMAEEPNVLAVLETLDRERLSTLFSPALTGPKINTAGFGKLEKARQAIPYGVNFHAKNIGLFLFLLTEKFVPKEKSELIARLGLTKAEVDAWNKLEPGAKKLEKALKSPNLKKPSQVYTLLTSAPGEEVLYLAIFSEERLVKDRLKNHLQKYLPTAQEVSDKELAHLNLEPGSPKFQAARNSLILAYVDGRVKKPEPPPPPPPPPGRPGRPPASNAPTVVPKAPTAPPPRMAPPPGGVLLRQPLTRPAGPTPPVAFSTKPMMAPGGMRPPAAGSAQQIGSRPAAVQPSVAGRSMAAPSARPSVPAPAPVAAPAKQAAPAAAKKQAAPAVKKAAAPAAKKAATTKQATPVAKKAAAPKKAPVAKKAAAPVKTPAKKATAPPPAKKAAPAAAKKKGK